MNWRRASIGIDTSPLATERCAQALAQRSLRSVASGDVSMPMEARRKLIAALWACDHPNVDPDGRQVLSVWAAEDFENPFR